ncbi:MAG: 5-formyltetrahydrofolate cyclo-ligase [Desulfobacterales bacterium S7086C20]|nr:MAG: 5-formyltetrahydrofolate cyclo-ligase [Desulfobacterales bacterium S7086C20]
MQDLKEKKNEIRNEILVKRDSLKKKEHSIKSKQIVEHLFGFANFLEAKTVLFYMNSKSEVATDDMIRRAIKYKKAVVLPLVNTKDKNIIPLKIENLDRDVQPGYHEIREPIAKRCKQVPIEYIDLAIVPGIAFDERGGRIGHGTGFYDKFIPKLDATTRKVALAFECQIAAQIPMEPHDRYIDIIITEKRIIYKI